MTSGINFWRDGKKSNFVNLSTVEQKRARRVRRMNFRVYVAIWLGFFIYASWIFFTAGDATAALDQFVPLQVVVGLAAFAVFWSGRSLRRSSTLRKMRTVPVMFTALGLFGTAVAAVSVTWPDDIYVEPSRATQVEAPTGPILVSL